MSNHRLPTQLNLEKICRTAPKEGSHWQGTLELGALRDLPSELQSQTAIPVEIELNCGVDESGFCVVSGKMNVDLTLICQRCMKPFCYPLKTEWVVSPVENDEAAKDLPGRYDPLLVTEGEINLSAWIAEELYLALPFAPRHESPCESYMNNNEKDEDLPKKESPFSVLKKQ